MILAVLIGSITLSVCGQSLFKSGMNRVGRIGGGSRPDWRAGVTRVALGLVAYGLSMLLWLFTLSRVELSYAFPFVSLSFVGIALVARFVLNERVDRYRVLGSILIVLGVVVVGLTR